MRLSRGSWGFLPAEHTSPGWQQGTEEPLFSGADGATPCWASHVSWGPKAGCAQGCNVWGMCLKLFLRGFLELLQFQGALSKAPSSFSKLQSESGEQDETTKEALICSWCPVHQLPLYFCGIALGVPGRIASHQDRLGMLNRKHLFLAVVWCVALPFGFGACLSLSSPVSVGPRLEGAGTSCCWRLLGWETRCHEVRAPSLPPASLI
jgi:hypothetical protein